MQLSRGVTGTGNAATGTRRIVACGLCFDFYMAAGGRAQVFNVLHQFTKWARDSPVVFILRGL